jgi:uncharacterized protein with GYD domain
MGSIPGRGNAASNDETLTRALVVLATLGNLRTKTLRGFGEKEMEAVLSGLPG